jgi:hypothetical protein
VTTKRRDKKETRFTVIASSLPISDVTLFDHDCGNQFQGPHVYGD